MKQARTSFLLCLIVVGGLIYASRGILRDRWFELRRPRLPVAVSFSPRESDVVAATSPRDALPRSPDPFENRGPLPESRNLAVPFTSQAPFGDWSLPYQEACEEASLIMVDGYYRRMTGRINPEDAKREILALVEFEKKFLGHYEDTNAAETAKLMKAYFHYSEVIVKEFTAPDEIRRPIANGFPVILPAAGRMLGNPNFRSGGPLYHMLVVKGYTRDRFITNDPGTRRGAEYLYDPDTLLKATHDWNGGKVAQGKRVMIIVLPRTEAL